MSLGNALFAAALVGAAWLIFKLLDARRAARQLARLKLAEAVDEPGEAHPAQPAAEPPTQPAVEDPYRANAPHPVEPDPDAELARLAAEGQRHVDDESAREGAQRRQQLEWLRLYRLCNAMKLLPPAPVVRVSETVPAEAEFPPAGFVQGDDADRVGPPPPGDIEAATQKAHAEKAWLGSLPFALEGYFAVLAAPPLGNYSLVVTIALDEPGRVPGADIVEGVVHLHDVEALVNVSPGAVWPITVRSSFLSGWSGSVFAHSNERIPPYVHGLVDKVLLPLHRSRSIARVTLACA